MNKHAVLNHRDHLTLKLNQQYSVDLGDGVNSMMVFPVEYRDIQSHYPIFFQKNPDTGEFYSLALFGFERGENLFLADNRWDAPYLPLMVEKQPFFIGFQEDKEADGGKAMMVTADLDSPRLTSDDGVALFNPDGSPTECLQRKMNVLERVHQGNEHSIKFIEAITELELLEPFSLEVTLADGSNNQLLGFYTLKEEAIQALNGEQLERLSKEGFLISLFMIIASHSRIGDLVNRKNLLNQANS